MGSTRGWFPCKISIHMFSCRLLLSLLRFLAFFFCLSERRGSGLAQAVDLTCSHLILSMGISIFRWPPNFSGYCFPATRHRPSIFNYLRFRHPSRFRAGILSSLPRCIFCLVIVFLPWISLFWLVLGWGDGNSDGISAYGVPSAISKSRTLLFSHCSLIS